MMKRKHLSKSRHYNRKKTAEISVEGWIYGIHTTLAVIGNTQRHVKRIVVAAQSADDLESRLSAAADACTTSRPQLEIRDYSELTAMLAKGAVHQGAAVLADPLDETPLEDICLDAKANDKAVVVILDQASDPRNIGAVIRSAAAFGALAVIVQQRHTPKINAVMAKAASGGLEKLPLVRVTNIVRAMGMLKDAGFWSVGLDANASKTIATSDLDGKVALVLGAEGSGMRRLTSEACDMLASISSADKLDSLNLSTAAAIALYEFCR